MNKFFHKTVLFSLASIFAITALSAQEALKSTEEEYYDFLSLTGEVTRPTLGYRTLSDSKWDYAQVEEYLQNEDGTFSLVRIDGKDSEHNVWKNNNLGKRRILWQPKNPAQNWFTNGLNQNITLKIYGPQWYNSYNTAAPYGQNDGALWQGKGYNTSLTGGLRLEAYGFEATIKPQLSFSQNGEFEFINPNYSGSTYSGKADTYGYYGVASIDAPQRFGDKAIFTYDWGDTEIRWTWHSFTLGFGTQSPWIGPAALNPIIHSNNAASYPKADIGLRKTEIIMPYFGWNLGSIETRAWWGKLTESDFFDNDETNNENLITGFSLYYQFPFLKELTVGMNRTMLSKWSDMSAYTTLGIIIPGISSLTSGGGDASDQRFSAIVDYLNKKAGWEVYIEWARNDFSPSFEYILRYPFHTQAWTFGTKKQLDLPFNLKGEILLEITGLECSQDYDRLIGWYSTFYAHHKVTQGYTNIGQWLGAGIGTGGNSQHLGLTVYHSRGSVTLFGQRRNPDLDYTMYIDTRKNATDFANKIWTAEANIRAVLDFGVKASYFIIPNNLEATGSFVFEDEHNPLNVADNGNSEHRININISLGMKLKI